LRLANTFILLGILLVLVLIWTQLPQHLPTLEDLIDARAKGDTTQIQQLITQMPMVQVHGTVPVDVQNSSLDVNIDNYELDVNVTNSYLSVRGY